MALGLAGAGADVVVASRKLDACREVAAEIEALGRRALPVAVNMSHWDELDGLVDAVLRPVRPDRRTGQQRRDVASSTATSPT